MDILEALAFHGPLKMTHLTRKAKTNFTQLEGYLYNLKANGLVNEKEVGYTNVLCFMTTKGLEVFKVLKRQN
jgi:predicted transcriptional regulator